jgi:hypothetical protein
MPSREIKLSVDPREHKCVWAEAFRLTEDLTQLEADGWECEICGQRIAGELPDNNT